MKNVIAIVSCIAILATIVAFAGCGKTDLANSKYVGTWVGTKVTGFGGEENMDDVFEGGETRIELKPDGSVEGIMGGEALNCTWTEVSSGVKFKGDIRTTAKAEGDELVLKVIGVSMHLVREEG